MEWIIKLPGLRSDNNLNIILSNNSKNWMPKVHCALLQFEIYFGCFKLFYSSFLSFCVLSEDVILHPLKARGAAPLQWSLKEMLSQVLLQEEQKKIRMETSVSATQDPSTQQYKNKDPSWVPSIYTYIHTKEPVSMFLTITKSLEILVVPFRFFMYVAIIVLTLYVRNELQDFFLSVRKS